MFKFANCKRLPGRVNFIPKLRMLRSSAQQFSTEVVDMQAAEVICAIKVLLRCAKVKMPW
jgi:hypothetical protein